MLGEPALVVRMNLEILQKVLGVERGQEEVQESLDLHYILTRRRFG